MSQILDFLSGDGKDSEGRTFEEIMGFTLEQMEYCHDYIQWIFPLNEPSAFNPDAPILTDEEIEILKEQCNADTQTSRNVYEAVNKFLYFLGFYQPSHESNQKRIWIGPANHNHLRITRMLKFINLMGWNSFAKDIVRMMEYIATERNEEINPTSLSYWEKAVK